MKKVNKPNVIVICGPTASGKTELSIELAKKIDGEIVSADSMQIYKYMDIGSAKPTKEEMSGIKHYMLDFVEPDIRYSVAEYKKTAEKAIDEILSKTTFCNFSCKINNVLLYSLKILSYFCKKITVWMKPKSNGQETKTQKK